MYVLDERPEFRHIVLWADDGLSFIIHNPKSFEEEILPTVFKEARFSSFLRKVRRVIIFHSIIMKDV
jgi:hypothetical protein